MTCISQKGLVWKYPPTAWLHGTVSTTPHQGDVLGALVDQAHVFILTWLAT